MQDPNAPQNPLQTLLPAAYTPQELAAALEQYGRYARQPQIRTPGALATNLLAEAVRDYRPRKPAGAPPAAVQGDASSSFWSGNPPYPGAPDLTLPSWVSAQANQP